MIRFLLAAVLMIALCNCTTRNPDAYRLQTIRAKTPLHDWIGGAEFIWQQNDE